MVIYQLQNKHADISLLEGVLEQESDSFELSDEIMCFSLMAIHSLSVKNDTFFIML